MPDLIVRGSIWRALACFVAAQAGFRRASGGRSATWALPAYWIGFALALAHFLAAFHWHYGWSHDRAVAATAEQTARVFGVNWGGGVWVNYAFLAAWLIDAVVRTTRPARGVATPSAGTWALRAFYLIVIANGAITFARWPMNLVGVALVAALIWSWRPPSPEPVTRN
jgi:hypothetical protein